jgi:hypothetical protein
MFKLSVLFCCMFASSFASAEIASFNGADYSGVYACKGSNSKVGDYELQAKLQLNHVSSHDEFGVYDFVTETENSTIYHGQAIASAGRMALTFDIVDGRNAEFSTGLATMKYLGNNLWAYQNNYYEPDAFGGTYGSEYCVKQKINVAKKPKKRLQRNAGDLTWQFNA